MCAVTRFIVRRDSWLMLMRELNMCETWLFHVCDVTFSYECRDSFIRVTWLIHMCDMTHSYVWHDSFMCVTWRIHMRDIIHSGMWHDAFIQVIWFIHMCDMTHSYVWHDSYDRRIHTHTHCNMLQNTLQLAVQHTRCNTLTCDMIHTTDVTHSYAWHDSCICVPWLMR